MAELAGISREYVRNLEAGEYNVTNGDAAEARQGPRRPGDGVAGVNAQSEDEDNKGIRIRERARLIASVKSASTAERAAAIAALAEFLARDISEQLAAMSDELVWTREQMARSANAASRHHVWLMAWTAVLSLATLLFAAVEFVKFWRGH